MKLNAEILERAFDSFRRFTFIKPKLSDEGTACRFRR